MRMACKALSLVLVAGLCLTGCNMLPKIRGSSESVTTEGGYDLGLPPAAMLNITDVPYPDGFKIDRDGSFFFQDAFLEWGKLVYRGGAGLHEVYEFYKNEMPQHGWTPVDALHQSGTVTINFQKEQKKCRVFLHRKVGSTIVEAAVFPGPSMQPFK